MIRTSKDELKTPMRVFRLPLTTGKCLTSIIRGGDALTGLGRQHPERKQKQGLGSRARC